MSEPEVLVAGAGPTGLSLALVLARLGIRVRIIDKTAAAAPYSRALGVQARTLEFYGMLGFAEEVVAAGATVAGINLWSRGRKAARVPIGTAGEGLTPYPYALVYPQDAHERLLIAHLEAAGVTVERETELVAFTQSGDGVDAVLAHAGGSRETCAVAYLAGCDGAHSTVRTGLGTGFPGGTYTGLFYVADVDAAGPAVDGEIHVELDAADLLIVFPMKGAGRIRLVGTVRDEAAPTGRALGFDDVSARAIERLRLRVERVNWFSTYQVHHRVANRFRTGRAFLLGDAAHVHSPVGAQGMNTGIGDAMNLAWKLAAVLRNTAAAALLDTYEAERRAFALRLVATTDRIFTVASRPGGLARTVRSRIFPAVAPLVARLAPARRFVFRTASQLAISYPRSPLSRGRAGSVRGGDRLPWVQYADGTDNFALLAALAWQAHVYGDPAPELAAACAELHLPLHALAWSHAAARAGLRRDALYLVRPDGYVALAAPSAAAVAALHAYARESF